MFNLFRSRDKMVRFFLGALLVVVSLSMLTYLIPSYNTGGSASDTIVAQIGKEALTLPEVQRVIQASLRGKQLPPEMIPHYVPQVIQQMVTERALAYEAQRLGYMVTDDDVATAVQTMVPSLFPDGKFVGKDSYAAMLAQQNLTIPEFEDNLRRQLLITRLRDIALEGTVVSPAEVEQEYRSRNEKVKIQYVKMTPDKYRSEAQPSQDELRRYYDSNKAQFQIPERLSLGIVVIDQQKLEASLIPTDADLQRLYSNNKESFRTQERVKVRHILLTTTGKTPQEEAAIKAKAEDLLKQIKAGGNFAELAKKNSEDPGSKQNGGELPDWVVKGQTVPEFEKVAFSLPPGQTSDLVKTQYGYHIIQVIAHEQARLRPFEEVKAELATQWKKQQAQQQLQATIDRAQSMLKKNPQDGERIANEMGLQYVKADNVVPGQAIPEIGQSAEFENSLAGLKKNDVSPAVQVSPTKVAMAVVTQQTPPHQASFEEATELLQKDLVNQKLATIMNQKATELLSKAQSMGGDLTKAAKSMGLDVQTSDEFTRAGAITGVGTATYAADAFTKPVGSLFGPVPLPEDARLVGKVLNHIEADILQLAAQRANIREELKSKKARERNALFEDGVREKLIQEGKIKIHQDVINRLTSGYRG